jgi:hypothetical protein
MSAICSASDMARLLFGRTSTALNILRITCGRAGDLTYVTNPAQLFWQTPLQEQSNNLDQVNVLVTASPTACGNYDVQITSGGVTGNGFQADPQDAQNTAQGNRGTLPVVVTTASVTQGIKKISKQSQSVVVGQKVSLSGEVDNLMNGVSVASQSWTFSGGSYVGDYLHTAGVTASGSAPPPVVNATDLDFYFTDMGSGINVTYTATLSDMSKVSNYTIFDVVRPSAISITATPGTRDDIGGPIPEIGPVALYNGLATSTSFGVKFAAKYTEPTNYTGGTTQWVQTGTAITTKTLAQTGETEVTTCSGLDTTDPYDTRQTTSDSPSQQLLSTGSEYARADSLTMWLMWKPPVTGAAIFVPLAKVAWSWSADVSSADNWSTWTFVSKTPAGDPAPLAPVNATDFPVW